MKVSKRILSILITLSLLFAYSSQLPATTSADSSSDKIEVQSLRTPNSKTYQHSDGSFECVAFAEDIHYYDTSGNLVDIDCSIIDDSASLQYKYKNAANSWSVRFSNYLSNKDAVLIQKDEFSLSYELLDSSNQNEVQRTLLIPNEYSDYYDEISQDNRAVIYQDVISNIDIVYSVRNGEIKEDIILKEHCDQNEFDFITNATGVSPSQEGKDIIFRDSSGNEVFRIGKLYMIDANGKYSEDLNTELIEYDNSTVIRLIVSDEFLNADDTVYPVVIDPSTTITGAASTYDTCVDEQYPSSNYYTSQNLWTGGKNGTNTMRTYIRFALPTNVSTSNIDNVYLRLKKNQYATPGIKAYRVTSSWSSSTVTWNNKPGFTTSGATGSCSLYSGDWYQINVTTMVKQWLNGTYSNYGFLLKEPTETNADQKTRWYSSDAPSPNKPELVIFYTLPQDRTYAGVVTTSTYRGISASIQTPSSLPSVPSGTGESVWVSTAPDSNGAWAQSGARYYPSAGNVFKTYVEYFSGGVYHRSEPGIHMLGTSVAYKVEYRSDGKWHAYIAGVDKAQSLLSSSSLNVEGMSELHQPNIQMGPFTFSNVKVKNSSDTWINNPTMPTAPLPYSATGTSTNYTVSGP